MNKIDRLLIICLLVSKTLEIDKVVEFVDVIEDGCLSKEQDSIDYMNEMVASAKKLPLTGIYGEIVKILLEIHKLESMIDELNNDKLYLDAFMTKIEQHPKNVLAEKIMLSKLTAFLRNRPSTLQTA